MKLAKATIYLCSILALISCGGGGGDGSDNSDANDSQGNLDDQNDDSLDPFNNEPSPPGPTPGPTPTPTPNSEPLEQLLGTVTFNSKFNNSSDIFEDIAVFSQIETVEDDRLVVDEDANIACATSEGKFEFLCVQVWNSGSRDMWYFDMDSNGSGSGDWEFCVKEVTTPDCAVKLRDDPAGTVTVRVSSSNQALKLKYDGSSNMVIIRHDVETFRQANKIQNRATFNGVRSSHPGVLGNQATKLDQVLRNKGASESIK